jgi:hypothetical protein
MTREELRRLLKQQPFQPFRVVLRDGRSYDITHPRMNLLAESYIKIGIPAPDLPPPIVDHTEYVRLDEISHTEPLPTLPTSAS